jgi:hypothetical protein
MNSTIKTAAKFVEDLSQSNEKNDTLPALKAHG